MHPLPHAPLRRTRSWLPCRHLYVESGQKTRIGDVRASLHPRRKRLLWDTLRCAEHEGAFVQKRCESQFGQFGTDKGRVASQVTEGALTKVPATNTFDTQIEAAVRNEDYTLAAKLKAERDTAICMLINVM